MSDAPEYRKCVCGFHVRLVEHGRTSLPNGAAVEYWRFAEHVFDVQPYGGRVRCTGGGRLYVEGRES